MDNILNLFRADRKGNKTMPEKFATDGLLSKQLNGGDPLFFQKYGWIKAIKNHIDVIKENESTFLYETSTFLSFSENEQLVKNIYLKGKNDRTVHCSSFNESESYVFSASFNLEKLQKLNESIFYYDYRCNYEKFKEYVFLPLTGSIGCNICKQNHNYLHRLLIINATAFLSELAKNHYEFQTAFENAKRDSEWLLMPLDPMADGIGYQSRIPVADFWNVEFYKY
ncbi:hypothetical protein [Draconibacterium sediminis]|uniref:hypothetical protein n=1 Tax=Draconibacterium sediminis TaxID=1544798 RepID=UPI0026F26198|nr:hypothetical protein [Draconibacterium sediminis]